LRPNISDWVALWDKLKVKFKQQDSEWRLLRLVQEIGDAAHALTYREYYGFKMDYNPEFKKALADAFAQLYMICFNEGFKIDEIETIGYKELEYAIEKRLPK